MSLSPAERSEIERQYNAENGRLAPNAPEDERAVRAAALAITRFFHAQLIRPWTDTERMALIKYGVECPKCGELRAPSRSAEGSP